MFLQQMVRKEGDKKREADHAPDSENDGAKEEGSTGALYRNWLEWIVSWTSALLLASAVGYLVWEGVTRHEPPSFEARVERVRETGNQYHVLLAVENTGDESVQALSLEVRLQQGDSTITTAAGDLSWLPARSTRKLAVVFVKDPRKYEILVAPKGYEMP